MRCLILAALILGGCSASAQERDSAAENAAENAMSYAGDVTASAADMTRWSELDRQSRSDWLAYLECLDTHVQAFSLLSDTSVVVAQAVHARCRYAREDFARSIYLRNQIVGPANIVDAEQFAASRSGGTYDDVLADVMTARALRKLPQPSGSKPTR